jgi:hypothetical protein
VVENGVFYDKVLKRILSSESIAQVQRGQ